MLIYAIILIKFGQNPGDYVEKTTTATATPDVQNHPGQLHQSAT